MPTFYFMTAQALRPFVNRFVVVEFPLMFDEQGHWIGFGK